MHPMICASAPAPRVLIADDQPHILEALRLLLRAEGIGTEVATSPDTVMSALDGQPFDLLLMDLNYARDTTSGREGLELINRVQAVDDTLPVVAMTGWASFDLVVDAMRQGVRDFVRKPWDNARLIDIVHREIVDGRERRRVTHRKRRDLEDAKLVQHHLLPHSLPAIDGWEVASQWKPMDDIGGDFFDVVRLDGSRVAICIADVVGKGMPAALLMSNLQGFVRASASEAAEPALFCAAVNRAIHGNLEAGRFISFLYCVLDSARGTLTWCNAGHNPAILKPLGGHPRLLADGGTVLGLFPDSTYVQSSTRVGPGDRVVLYTDGMTEAVNTTGEEYGADRLVSLVESHAGLEALPLRDTILESVSSFCGGQFNDDATLVILASKIA